MSSVGQLRSLAQRLCTVATGSEDEIRGVLGVVTEPFPLGAAHCDLNPGVLSRSSVELQSKPPMFTRFTDQPTAASGPKSVLLRVDPA